MKTFDEFSTSFMNFQNENSINKEDLVKYYFVIPQVAADAWKVEYKESVEEPKEKLVNMFEEMFTVGNNIFGIKFAEADDSTTVKLYYTDESEQEFTIDKILNSYVGKLIENPPSADVTAEDGTQTELPSLIKPESIILTSGFSAVDKPVSPNLGIIYSDKVRRDGTIYQDDISLFGLVHYQTGDIELIVNNINNDEKFVEYYEKCKELGAGSGSGGGNAGGSGNSGSGGTASYTPIPYDYLTISGTFTCLSAPVKIAYTFDIN